MQRRVGPNRDPYGTQHISISPDSIFFSSLRFVSFPLGSRKSFPRYNLQFHFWSLLSTARNEVLCQLRLKIHGKKHEPPYQHYNSTLQKLFSKSTTYLSELIFSLKIVLVCEHVFLELSVECFTNA